MLQKRIAGYSGECFKYVIEDGGYLGCEIKKVVIIKLNHF